MARKQGRWYREAPALDKLLDHLLDHKGRCGDELVSSLAGLQKSACFPWQSLALDLKKSGSPCIPQMQPLVEEVVAEDFGKG